VAKTTSTNLNPTSLQSLTGSLSGTIVDGNNTAIANATLLIKETGVTVQTDANGLFTFSDVYSGDFTLLVSKDGYQGFSTIVKVQANQSKALGDLNIDAYSITGAINLSNNADNSGILVSIKGTALTAVTDSDGNFTLMGMPAGNYELQANLLGYQSQSVLVSISSSQPSLNLASTIELQQFSLSGNITLSDDDDNSAIIISLLGTAFTTQTDANGDFMLTGVPIGNYKLLASKADYQHQDASISISSDNPNATLTYALALQPAVGLISGVVSLENQTAHSGVLVTLLNTQYTAQTDNLGSWSMTIPVGNYGAGIQYSRSLYANVIGSETVTVVDQGEYTAQAQGMVQNAMNLIMPVTSAGVCNQLEVHLLGLSGDATGFDNVVPVNNGQINQTVPYGNYRLETRCQDEGFEKIVQNISVTKLGDGQLINQLADVELRHSFVKINNDDALTKTTNVTLILGSTNADEMRITGDVVATDWLAFSDTHTLNLTSTDGDKSVLVEYRDINDISLGNVSDTIKLDSAVTISDFTATGASTKGDTLLVKLNLNGDLNAQVTASLPGLFSDYALFDNGVYGDNLAGDGIYSREIPVTTSLEINAQVSANAIDTAGNITSANTSVNVTTNTAPGILNVQVSSNISTQEMNIAFDTDEPTTSVIRWSNDPENLTNSKTVSGVMSPNHNVLLTGLSSIDITYYDITVTDAASNITVQTGLNKLAPALVENVLAQPGNFEIGVVWNPNQHPYTAGYRVYRSEDNATFTLVNPDQLLKGSYYLDVNAQNGTTYYYQVSAVDRANNEGIRSEVVSTTPQAALAGPTEITEPELWGEIIWIPSRSPYVIKNDVTTRQQARLRALPGTHIQLDTTSNTVVFNTSNAGQFWLMGEDNNRVLVEQVGESGSAYVSFNSQYDKADLFLTHEIDPVTRYTQEYFPLNGNVLRYVELNQAHDSGFNFGWSSSGDKKTIAHAVNASIKTLTLELLVDGSLHNTVGGINVGKNLNVTFDRYIYSGLSLGHVSESTITGFGEGSRSRVVGRIERSVFENIGSSATVSYSRFKNMSSNSGTVTESVIETTDGCNGTDLGSQRNIIWLDKTMAQIKECGVTDLYHYLPFLTSEDPLHDQDNDGIPDQVDHDSDNDGFSDLQELTAQEYFDPFDAASKPNDLVAKDHDGDDIPDVDDTDDDNDGISDADEISMGTSPYWVDSDGDGVQDKFEVDNGFNPLDANNYPLVRHRVGINVTDDKYKGADNKTIFLSETNNNSYTDRISYYENFYSTTYFYCYLCEIPANQDVYLVTDASLYYLNIPFEYGSRVQFIKGSADVYNIRININDSQLVNILVSADKTLASIDHSSISFSEINGYSYFSNYIYKSKLLDGGWGGVIKKSKIISPAYIAGVSTVVDSMFEVSVSFASSNVGGGSSVFRNSAIISSDDTWPSVGNSTTYFYDSYIKNVTPNGRFIRSDFVGEQADIQYDRSSLFMNESYLELDGNVIQSVGTPADNLGDGTLDTVLTYQDYLDTPQTLTVDGIASPKATPYFPNGADSVILLNDIGLQ